MVLVFVARDYLTWYSRTVVHRTLISSDLLEANLTNQKWIVIDCRFDLSDTTSGEQSYKEHHIFQVLQLVVMVDIPYLRSRSWKLLLGNLGLITKRKL